MAIRASSPRDQRTKQIEPLAYRWIARCQVSQISALSAFGRCNIMVADLRSLRVTRAWVAFAAFHADNALDMATMQKRAHTVDDHPGVDSFFSSSQADALERLAEATRGSSAGPDITDAPGSASSPPPQSGKGKDPDAHEGASPEHNDGHTGPVAAPPLQQLKGNTKATEKKKSGGESEAKAEKPDNPRPARRGLPHKAREQIVQMFATFQTLNVIRDAIISDFGIRVDDRTLYQYDPTKPYCSIGKRLRSLYSETRKAYVERAADVAISHQAHRLRKLEGIIEAATKSKDYSSALKGLELAAKEMGGVLEGRSTVTHTGAVAHVHGSTEDMRLELSMRLAALAESLPPPTPQGTVEVLALPATTTEGTDTMATDPTAGTPA